MIERGGYKPTDGQRPGAILSLLVELELGRAPRAGTQDVQGCLILPRRPAALSAGLRHPHLDAHGLAGHGHGAQDQAQRLLRAGAAPLRPGRAVRRRPGAKKINVDMTITKLQ